MSVSDPLVGVGLSLTVAVCWALSPVAHAAAGRRIGAFPTLLWRSLLASFLLLLTVAAARAPMPGRAACLAIGLSGVVGVGVGDTLIYEAFVRIGPRRTVQLLTLGPVFTCLLGWAALGEVLGPAALAGVALVLAASSAAVWIERRAVPGGREPGAVTRAGVACAVGGAVLMGGGAVLARLTYRLDPGMNPLFAAAARVVTATVALWAAAAVFRRVPPARPLFADPGVSVRIVAGTVLGPFLGMLAYVGAIKHLEAGLVTALISLSPLVILPVVAWRYRTRIGPTAIVAAAAAVGGVALISLRG